jgi:deazaflavin-dependent oxidoreductase (nitroreductase family)
LSGYRVLEVAVVLACKPVLMPLSRKMARFNQRFTNHVTRHIAGWVPGFALLEHVGRRSGRLYETPVNVFRAQEHHLLALTYGHSDWVKNVLAAGRCVIRTRRRRIDLVEPERFRDPTRHLVPIPARWILKLVDVDEFISLRSLQRADAT